MWLLHYSVSLEGSLEEALSEKSKDIAIKYHLVDLLPHHNYEKTRQEIWKKLDTKYNYGDKLCICNQVTNENVNKMSCMWKSLSSILLTPKLE